MGRMTGNEKHQAFCALEGRHPELIRNWHLTGYGVHEKRILGNTRFSLSQSVQVAGTAGPVQQGRGDKGQAPCPSAGACKRET
jgi:hypothetical protein